MLRTAETMLRWEDDGPPPEEEADYDDNACVWLWPIPGTPLIAEYVTHSYEGTPTIEVRTFHPHR